DGAGRRARFAGHRRRHSADAVFGGPGGRVGASHAGGRRGVARSAIALAGAAAWSDSDRVWPTRGRDDGEAALAGPVSRAGRRHPDMLVRRGAMKVTVLGAGYMGSAMAKVAHARGHEVRLWGTWLDEGMLAPVEKGEDHPRLQLSL